MSVRGVGWKLCKTQSVSAWEGDLKCTQEWGWALMMSLVGRHPVLIPLLEEEQEEEEKAKASGRSAVKQGKENMP